MTGLFEVIASADDPAETRAVIAAQTRAKTVFDRYLSEGDRETKLAFVADDIRKLAADVAEEYGVEDAERLYLAATVALGGGHPADCTCGFCENKGSFGKDDDGDEDDMEKESSVKTACEPGCTEDHEHDFEDEKKEASVTPYKLAAFDWEHIAAGSEDRSGDSYQGEREELPTSDGTGLGDTGAVPTDLSSSGDQTGWNLEPIDVHSEKHQLTHQDATDRAEYNDSDFDPSNPVRERVDAEAPMQPEYTNGPDTQTWSDKSTQAAPVTSKWKLLV